MFEPTMLSFELPSIIVKESGYIVHHDGMIFVVFHSMNDAIEHEILFPNNLGLHSLNGEDNAIRIA